MIPALTAMRFSAPVRAGLGVLAVLPWLLAADAPVRDTQRGDQMIAEYFRQETGKIARTCLADIHTLEDWTSQREEYRRQLLEMLGLDPWPERTELHPQLTHTTDHEAFTVERVHFQSRPGLYVTGNVYVPKGLTKPAPAILYVCGHGRVVKDGVAYGNKVHYQHHPAWYARNGYVCLTIDTLQLGEIEGIHHGTNREGMWWWNCRGYTPAGVEAWNCVRAIDYLQMREDVDGQRIGVTGRSGGGAYTWFIAAIDQRVTVAVPVAGITDLENHVVDGVIEGHCDCMYMVNSYRWDFGLLAALVAPRPLLISNTDKDGIFPLEGVQRIHQQVRKIYRLYGAADKLGLHITEGAHLDTQELHIHSFHWMNRFLKGGTEPIAQTAEKFFQPEQLKVFDKLPEDQRNTTIHETFVPSAPDPSVPADADAWTAQRDRLLQTLQTKTFQGWPAEFEPLAVEHAFSEDAAGLTLSAYDFTSQGPIRLRLYLLHRAGLDSPELLVLNVLDDADWQRWLAKMRAGFAERFSDEMPGAADADGFAEEVKMFQNFRWVMAYVAPRGVGPSAWNQTPQKQIHTRRRFNLLGQTLDGMQTWDVRRAIQAARSLDLAKNLPLWIQSERNMAGVALYASLFEPDISRLDLWHLPASHRTGPELLNVLKTMDMPQAVALAAERSRIRIYQEGNQAWEHPQAVAKALGWDPKQIQIRILEKPSSGGK